MPASLLIKNATIIHPGHSRHLKKSDLLIKKGKIEKIAASINDKATELKGDSLYLSVGWHDMRTHLSDPGLEHKESIHQLANTAARGGYTSFSTLPNTLPVMDNKGGIQYAINSNKGAASQVFPYGTVSEAGAGKDLAELYDMHQNGAIAFTDGDLSMNSGLLQKALLYVQAFNGLIISFAIDPSLHRDGQINESAETVKTGLRTSPSLAEYSCIKQQLDILEYTGGRLHFSCISSAESVNLIKQAKKKGLNVSCDVGIYNLCFTDREASTFDSNFKLLPPLRTEKDRKTLIKGVNEGTIDAVVSNHHAQNAEVKNVEFDYADFGAFDLSLVSSLYEMHLSQEIDRTSFVMACSSNPRKILGLEQKEIKVGAVADLCVWDSESKWSPQNAHKGSEARNSHLWKKEVHGKVVACIRASDINLY